VDAAADLVSHAIASARAAGAYQADAALSESESFESRVRGSEIDFVKQSAERGLGIRVFYGGRWGLSTASTRTSDLSRDVEILRLEPLAKESQRLVDDPDQGKARDLHGPGFPIHPREREKVVDHRDQPIDVLE
jgi:PmbA protein